MIRRALVAAVVVAATATGCAHLPDLPNLQLPSVDTTTDPAWSVETGVGLDPDTARDLLDTLTVRVEDTGAHYDRDEWGSGWADHGNECSTRELVLHDQGTGVVNGDRCAPVCPASGPACWTSPYDGKQARDPSTLDLDHRVPVAEANRSGARNWTAAQRDTFYQDPTNLVAVTAAVNRSKGDDDPGRWRPPNRASWCGYAVSYVTTKSTYNLHVDPAELAALRSMLRTC
jgi:hypothetical protein